MIFLVRITLLRAMPSLSGLVVFVLGLFEDAYQAAFFSTLLSPDIEANFRVEYAEIRGGSLSFQLECVVIRLLWVLIVHQEFRRYFGGSYANNVAEKLSTMAKESRTINARAARKVYCPLEGEEYRLVRLHPHCYKGQEAGDDADNNISCSLFIVTLDDHPRPEYEAVSYVWGSNSDLQAIQLNRERFWVTKNLSEALKALRLPDRDRVLWIDALAINQSSFSERAEQVTLIPEIYMNARDTLIWLNDDNMCKIEENPLWAHLCNRRGRRQTSDVSPILRDSEQSWCGEDASSLLSDLSSLQYWHRVWIAQEVVHSRRATLVTPFRSVSFGVLEDLLEPEIMQSFPATRSFKSTLKEFQKTCLALRPADIFKGSEVDLDTWIQTCISRKCYDPRDYVFGLLGCFPWQVRVQVKVNYRHGPDSVLKAATLAFLRLEGHLDYLQYSNHFNQELRWTSGLPSWVPAFTLERTKKQSAHDADRTTPLTLLRRSRRPISEFLEWLEGSNVLQARGRWVGHVRMVDSELGDIPRVEAQTTPSPQALHLRDRLRLLNVQNDELGDFCDAIGPAESVTAGGEVSELQTILGLQALCAEDYGWALACEQPIRGSGEQSLLAAHPAFTMLRLQDPQEGRGAFGVTWGDGSNVRPGDKICLLESCSHALILRAVAPSRWNLWQRHRQGRYRLIGCTVLRGGGYKEQDWFEKMRLTVGVDDIFLR